MSCPKAEGAIEPRKIVIAGAESFYSLEGDLCGTVMRRYESYRARKALPAQISLSKFGCSRQADKLRQQL